MTEERKQQILKIRDTGLTNMFDIDAVCMIALSMGYGSLVAWIENNKGEYCRFILTGK